MDGIMQGDCLDVLRGLAANSVDAIVTDPPYGLSEHPDVVEVLTCWLAGKPYTHRSKGFMGKQWDAFVPGPEYWREVYRVLKPGGHALVFAGTRTDDVMGIALRLAGFEIRDKLAWLYGSGFPKSLDISKAIDKAAKAERKIIGRSAWASNNAKNAVYGKFNHASEHLPITEPATVEAQRWQGFGTALKPAQEPIILCRKPISERTVAANVLRWGVGALNIDATRVQAEVSPKPWATPRGGIWHTDSRATAALIDNTAGRWPANLVLDEEAAALLDAQSGVTRSSDRLRRYGAGMQGYHGNPNGFVTAGYSDTGGPSRYFYIAKASRAERNAGCEAMPLRTAAELTGRKEGSAGLKNPRASSRGSARTNTHPTVKPIALMRYLIRLITPPGGTVLDCFAGSGTTVVAAIEEGMRYVAIEREGEYIAIIEARAQHALRTTEKPDRAVTRRKVASRTQKPATVATIAQVALWESEGAA